MTTPLKKGVDFTGATSWNGNDLKGEWLFTLKIDGVRAFWRDGVGGGPPGWISRAGKPLYNINAMPMVHDAPHCSSQGVEVYCSEPGRSSKENYKATIEKVRAKTKERPVSGADLYVIEPLDGRLLLNQTVEMSTLTNPSAELISLILNKAVADGYEGLVLRQGSKWLKVKPIETYDVKVTGIIEGTGKHKGRMGALMTEMGIVGTGFSDAEREEWWAFVDRDITVGMLGRKPIFAIKINRTIEVECMQLTPGGKFRHPRFLRIRYDK
jgi:DNA ligase-1